MALRRRRDEKYAGFSFNSWRKRVSTRGLATGWVDSRWLAPRGHREAKWSCKKWEDVTGGLLVGCLVRRETQSDRNPVLASENSRIGRERKRKRGKGRVRGGRQLHGQPTAAAAAAAAPKHPSKSSTKHQNQNQNQQREGPQPAAHSQQAAADGPRDPVAALRGAPGWKSAGWWRPSVSGVSLESWMSLWSAAVCGPVWWPADQPHVFHVCGLGEERLEGGGGGQGQAPGARRLKLWNDLVDHWNENEALTISHLRDCIAAPSWTPGLLVLAPRSPSPYTGHRLVCGMRHANASDLDPIIPTDPSDRPRQGQARVTDVKKHTHIVRVRAYSFSTSCVLSPTHLLSLPGRRAAEELLLLPQDPASVLAAQSRPLLVSYSRRAREVMGFLLSQIMYRRLQAHVLDGQHCLPVDFRLRCLCQAALQLRR
ncbi:hypothetical protein N431DRAFT_444966 [Stipitochalara longipes BDJ]|nr:hypothetical protein N431DRAFT_444966 [Stipitochalara longipes BDJ]